MSKITFEKKVLVEVHPWATFCSVCGVDFEQGDLVGIVTMANGRVTLVVDDNCLDQFQGFLTLAVLDKEGMESLEVPSRVN